MTANPKNGIHFSIIIAHKNIPDLLVRCLDSIPNRQDIQIIVVDDNSSPEIVDFSRFPGRDREDVEIILTHRSGGTGYAQNVGLEHARGKWVLFIGADDFYTEELNGFLDRMVDVEEDLIIFDHRSVLEKDISVSVTRSEYLSILIRDYLDGRIDENSIRCNYVVVTCKMFRKEMIDKHHIRFHETRWSNDNYFAAQASCFAKSIKVCDDVLYVMTVGENSLTSNFVGSRKEALTRLQEAIHCDKLLREHGLEKENQLTNTVLRAIFERHSAWDCMAYCLSSVSNGPVFKAMAHSLVRKTVNRFNKLFK